MVHVQVREEHLRHPRRRHLHHVVVDAAAWTGVEDEAVSVPQLDEDARTLLVRPDDVAPAGSHERDTHLVRVEFLTWIEPQIRAGDDRFESCRSSARLLLTHDPNSISRSTAIAIAPAIARTSTTTH